MKAKRIHNIHLTRSRRSRNLIYLLLQVILCVVSIRCQVTNRPALSNGGHDSIPTQTVRPQNISPQLLDTNDPSQFASNPDQSNDDGTDANPGGKNNNDQTGAISDPTSQAGTDSNPPSTNTPAVSQNTAAATTPTPSPTARPQSQPTPKPHSEEKSGLSQGAIAGIVYASRSIILFAFAIMYFRGLERAIAEDKRKQREKEVRKYNMTYNGSTPVQPSYLPRTYESSYEV